MLLIVSRKNPRKSQKLEKQGCYLGRLPSGIQWWFVGF
jgi:hypothetical protein